MKKLLLLYLVSILFLMTSCYVNPVNEYVLTIVDNGACLEDLNCHIVTVSAPQDFTEIYYSFGTESPTFSSTKYSPKTYRGIDSNSYIGVLVKSGSQFNAIAYKNTNGKKLSSFLAQKEIDVEGWNINIIDNIPYSLDTTKHIVSISDPFQNGKITYYVESGESNDISMIEYEPNSFMGSNLNSYKGILVDVGDTVWAVSHVTIAGKEYSSSVKSMIVNHWDIKMTDYGQGFYDNSSHIISIEDPINSGTIYYTLDGSEPTISSIKYEPTTYRDNNAEEHIGILVEEGSTIKAVSILNEDVRYSSYCIKENVSVYRWNISIENKGTYSEDETKYVISIMDSSNGDIFYTTDGTNPNPDSILYSPMEYQVEDSKKYYGVLVNKWSTVKAISYETVNELKRSSSYVKLDTKRFSVGDVGPAGGLIFYDKGSYSDGWRYLEAAPQDLEDILIFGFYEPHKVYDYKDGEYEGIGKGKSNTEMLVFRMSFGGAYLTFDTPFANPNAYKQTNKYAAKLCQDYEVEVDESIFDDWFLPSRDELNMMYINLHKERLGNFKNSSYWSSSEYYSNLAWFQDFSTGEQKKNYRYYEWYIRPARAF